MGVVLRPISAAAAEAVAAGRRPDDVRVATDYPTEFSDRVARRVGLGSPLGPFFMHRAADDVRVGEIGGGITEPGRVEIGYAVVASDPEGPRRERPGEQSGEDLDDVDHAHEHHAVVRYEHHAGLDLDDPLVGAADRDDADADDPG